MKYFVRTEIFLSELLTFIVIVLLLSVPLCLEGVSLNLPTIWLQLDLLQVSLKSVLEVTALLSWRLMTDDRVLTE